MADPEIICPSPLVKTDSDAYYTWYVFGDCVVPCPSIEYTDAEWDFLTDLLTTMAFISLVMSLLSFISHVVDYRKYYIQCMFIGGFCFNSFITSLFFRSNRGDKVVCSGPAHFIQEGSLCIFQAAAFIFSFIWVETWSVIFVYDTYLHVTFAATSRDVPRLRTRYTLIATALSSLITLMPLLDDNLGFDAEANIPLCLYRISENDFYFWYTFFLPLCLLIVLAIGYAVLLGARINHLFVDKPTAGSSDTLGLQQQQRQRLLTDEEDAAGRGAQSREHDQHHGDYDDEEEFEDGASDGDHGDDERDGDGNGEYDRGENRDEQHSSGPIGTEAERGRFDFEGGRQDHWDHRQPSGSVDGEEYEGSSDGELEHDNNVSGESGVDHIAVERDLNQYQHPTGSGTHNSFSVLSQVSSIMIAPPVPSQSDHSFGGIVGSSPPSSAAPWHAEQVQHRQQQYAASLSGAKRHPGMLSITARSNDSVPPPTSTSDGTPPRSQADETEMLRDKKQRLQQRRRRSYGSVDSLDAQGSMASATKRGVLSLLPPEWVGYISRTWKYNGLAIIFVIVFCFTTLCIAPMLLYLYYFTWGATVNAATDFAECLIRASISTLSNSSFPQTQEAVDTYAHENCGSVPGDRPNRALVYFVLVWASSYGIIPALVFGFAGYSRRLHRRCCGHWKSMKKQPVSVPTSSTVKSRRSSRTEDQQ